jgi:hypothetical protein
MTGLDELIATLSWGLGHATTLFAFGLTVVLLHS